MTVAETLGALLRQQREANALTLRDVEDLTGLSNGYLSLLENDKVRQPRPPVLYKLAQALGASYVELMERAGYAPTNGPRADQTQSRPAVAFKGAERLTPDQRKEVQDFIDFKLQQLARQQRRGATE
jgi:HTH-type transcriptional regulator, competence development regulator